LTAGAGHAAARAAVAGPRCRRAGDAGHPVHLLARQHCAAVPGAQPDRGRTAPVPVHTVPGHPCAQPAALPGAGVWRWLCCAFWRCGGSCVLLQHCIVLQSQPS
jgi:hypothetical protein